MKRINKLFFCHVIDTSKDAFLTRIDGTNCVILASTDFGDLTTRGFRIVVIGHTFYELQSPLSVGVYTRALRRAHRVSKYIICNRRLPYRM